MSNWTTAANWWPATIYRLQQEDINSVISYSKVTEVMCTAPGNNITVNLSVYPNPAVKTISLVINDKSMATGNYSISIANASGQTIKQVTTSQPAWQGAVADLIPGTYLIRVVNSKDNSLVGNSRFVKL